MQNSTEGRFDGFLKYGGNMAGNRKEVKFYFLVAMVALIVSLTCNSFTNQVAYTDSSVFQYVATEMQHGNVPYLDTFDHKGPLLYAINYLGLSISHNFGIWFIELAVLTVSILFFYRIARLCIEPLPSLLVVVISMVPLCFYLQAGNLTEEYALPLITISLYIFLQYFITGRCSNWSVVWCGVCFGGVLLLRPNMIAVWIAGCLLVLVDCVRKKTFPNLFRFIGFFLLGLGICVVPFVIYLLLNGALSAAYESYIVFNFLYSTSELLVETFINNVYSLLFKYFPLLSTFGVVLYILYERTCKALMVALSWLLSIILILISRTMYPHYAIVIIPTAIYPIAYLSSWFLQNNMNSKRIASLYLATLMFIGVIPSSNSLVKDVGHSVSQFVKLMTQEPELDPVVRILLEKTNPEDRITVYGNQNEYYLLSKRMSASKYSYQLPIGNIDPTIFEEYFEDLNNVNPKVVVWPGYTSSPNCKTDKMFNYIQEHGYLQDSTDGRIFYLP